MQNLSATEALRFLGFEHDPAFINSGNPMEKNDVKLGEMNPFEVSCLSSLERLEKKRKEITGGKKSVSELSTSEKSEWSSIKKNSETIHDLMWSSIKSRYPEHEGDGIALRDGNVIVSFKLTDEQKIEKFFSMVGLPGIGIIGIDFDGD